MFLRAGGSAGLRLQGEAERSRGIPLYAGRLLDDVPERPLDDAAVFGPVDLGQHQRAVQVSAEKRPDGLEPGLRSADADRSGFRHAAGGGRRRQAGGRGGLPGGFRADLRRDRPGSDLDVLYDQRDGADHPGDVCPGGPEAGGGTQEAAGDDPERHPEGVHRPGDLDLPAGAVDQAGGRPGGVLQQGDPAVQRDQRLGDAHHGIRGQYDAGGRPGDLDRGGLHPGGPEAGIPRSTRSPRSFRSICRSAGAISTSSRTSAGCGRRGGTGPG